MISVCSTNVTDKDSGDIPCENPCIGGFLTISKAVYTISVLKESLTTLNQCQIP